MDQILNQLNAYKKPIELAQAPMQEEPPSQPEPEPILEQPQQEEQRSYLKPDESRTQKFFTEEQVEKLASIPTPILQKLEEDPNNWNYIESIYSLSKIKDLSVIIAKQRRFIPGTSNIAVLMMRKDDGSQVIDKFVPFGFFRDTRNRTTWAIFSNPKPWARKWIKLPLIGKGKIFWETTQRLFNTELAIPSIYGWLSAFDAGTLEQTPLTNDKNIIPLYHKLDREMTQTIQNLILANTEAERLKKKGTFWEKYGTQMLMFLAILVLALAIFQMGSTIAGLKDSLGTLGTQISSLSNILPKTLGGLPTS